jgi:hypothetical protein
VPSLRTSVGGGVTELQYTDIRLTHYDDIYLIPLGTTLPISVIIFYFYFFNLAFA